MRSILICLALALPGMASAETPAIEVGQPFPLLALPSAEDGRPTSVAAFRGKKVILHVFASW